MNNVLSKIEDIDYGWRGTCCEVLLSDKKFIEYLNFISSKNALDVKNRFHYYIKSFTVPQLISDLGIKNVFHVGFGDGKRYPLSYEYFNINFFGCELPENENQSWFKSNSGINKENILLKNFLNWNDQDFKLFLGINPANLVVVSEATFYYILMKNEEFNNRHIATSSDIENLKCQLKNVINSFVKNGIKHFVFIEPDDSLFEDIAKENNFFYSKLEFNEQFKYDFLLDYRNFRKNPNFFTKIHILSCDDLSNKLKACTPLIRRDTMKK